MSEFPVDGPITVAFKISSGSVDVIAEDRPTATVAVEPADRRGESRRPPTRPRSSSRATG